MEESLAALRQQLAQVVELMTENLDLLDADALDLMLLITAYLERQPSDSQVFYPPRKRITY